MPHLVLIPSPPSKSLSQARFNSKNNEGDTTTSRPRDKAAPAELVNYRAAISREKTASAKRSKVVLSTRCLMARRINVLLSGQGRRLLVFPSGFRVDRLFNWENPRSSVSFWVGIQCRRLWSCWWQWLGWLLRNDFGEQAFFWRWMFICVSLWTWNRVIRYALEI